jgi:N6-L-threonylcarbamoyladenine synthase/protein kinase Bud32
MVKKMAEENGADFSVPKGYCGDNGAMIAWTGLLMRKNGVEHSLSETAVDSGFRTDRVDISWAVQNKRKKKGEEGKWKGAEAILTRQDGKLVKERVRKEYRIEKIDSSIGKSRTKKEPKLLSKARALGVPTPEVFDVLEEENKIIMEYLDGKPLYDVIEKNPELANELGRLVRTLHDNNIVHGDLTTSNVIQKDGKLHMIDFGLGNVSRKDEDKATDLLLLKKALNANHSTNFNELWKRAMSSYGESEVRKRLEVAEKRGRYL